jgi:hypothetical protein
MPRPRARVSLQQGLMLNLPKLIRRRFAIPGGHTGPSVIRWTYEFSNSEVALGLLTANLEHSTTGWLRIQIGSLDQRITLYRQPRHFGGGQWYFLCPKTNRQCSVVWMPPGARQLASRQAWGRQVAYQSQFQPWYDRALSAAQRLRCSLGGPDWAGIDDEFDPPKPKWMRKRTYEGILARSYKYEEIADDRLVYFVARLMGRG